MPTPSSGGSTPSTSNPPGGGTGTGTSSPPCADDDADCLPQPTAPPPPTPHTTPTTPDTGDGGGGGGGGAVGWITRGITSAINSFFRSLVTAALNPLLDLLGRTLLTTPKPSDLPAIGELWTTSWGITVATYSILIMIGGITIMMFQSVQARTSIKEITPRIPLGFLAATLSQFLAGKAIEIANPLPAAILGQGLDPDTASQQLRNIILGAIAPPIGPTGATGVVNRSIFFIFLGLFLAGSIVALLCTYIARITITVALIGIAPLALSGHALPQTEKIAYWWWKAFFSCISIQISQSFVLIASFKVFFAPGGFTVFGPKPDGLVNLLAAITLIYFLFKIPFWMMPKIGQGGGSVLGRIVRAYVTGRALGLLGGGRFGRGPQRTPTARRRQTPPPRRQAQNPITRRPPRQPPRGRTTPQFLQPRPAVPMHDLANGKATGPPPPATFLPPSMPGGDPGQTVRPRPRPTGPPSPPVFRSPDSASSTADAAGSPPAQPFRPPTAPARVRFQPPSPEPAQRSTPVRPRGPVPPVSFRAPKAPQPAGSPPRAEAPGRRARTATAMPVIFSSPAPGSTGVSPPMPPPVPRRPAAPQTPRRPRPQTPRPAVPQAPRPPRPPAPRRAVPMPRFTAPPPVPGGERP
ncbi:hypothetical protein [Frankia sp. ACN10a]|uniref:hypothetical protein n=1 Tax=Frankia sp. ACN10a TaxID=2926031 RepID=UPI002118E0A8|nr:hypothetical protein [Frankia sp. ACN10a]